MTDNVNNTPVKVKRGTKRATLALFLSLCALGLAGYIYYYALKVHARTIYQLQSLEQIAHTNSQDIDEKLTNLTNNLGNLKNKVNGLSNDKFGAINYQINTLVSLANQSLVVYHDVGTAIKLLNYVNDVVAGNNNAMYTELKVALNTDLNQLNQLPVVDRVVIATRLNNIIYNTDHLELISKSQSIQNSVITNTAKPKWKEFLYDIETKLYGLVQISNTNNSLNLLPQHEVIIHQNVKLDILNAKMALLQNDETNWQYSLNDAKNILAMYFVNNTNAQNVVAQIDQLEQLNISTATANIDQTLKALNKLNNLSTDNVVK